MLSATTGEVPRVNATRALNHQEESNMNVQGNRALNPQLMKFITSLLISLNMAVLHQYPKKILNRFV
jgi:hypothetical protein